MCSWGIVQNSLRDITDSVYKESYHYVSMLVSVKTVFFHRRKVTGQLKIASEVLALPLELRKSVIVL